MKRSEMVQEIVAEIDMNYPEVRSGLAYDSVEQVAENILRRMEDAGMLPPQIIKNDPAHFNGDAFSYTMNEWEPED